MRKVMMNIVVCVGVLGLLFPVLGAEKEKSKQEEQKAVAPGKAETKKAEKAEKPPKKDEAVKDKAAKVADRKTARRERKAKGGKEHEAVVLQMKEEMREMQKVRDEGSSETEIEKHRKNQQRKAPGDKGDSK